MALKTVLFDLDGTLLPMDQDTFANSYFTELSKKLSPLGYEPKELVKTIWQGTAAMVTNDGSKTNEQAFWDLFVSKYGDKVLKDKPIFDKFYENEFENVKSVCGYNKNAKECINAVKELGLKTALATNPIFPGVATKARINWAGLCESDFEFYTTYQNSRFCKPNLNYYLDVVKSLNVLPEECLMVGNDVEEDMIAKELNINVFLITDCLINKKCKDKSVFPNGNLSDLIEFIKSDLL
ncbi:MAG: HAD family hydrolase [Oscillospiraceae bacterium]|nr:HAD family hydrolase [Oscillospiraceae bacterium]